MRACFDFFCTNSDLCVFFPRFFLLAVQPDCRFFLLRLFFFVNCLIFVFLFGGECALFFFLSTLNCQLEIVRLRTMKFSCREKNGFLTRNVTREKKSQTEAGDAVE